MKYFLYCLYLLISIDFFNSNFSQSGNFFAAKSPLKLIPEKVQKLLAELFMAEFGGDSVLVNLAGATAAQMGPFHVDVERKFDCFVWVSLRLIGFDVRV